jgi:hypothetical protein
MIKSGRPGRHRPPVAALAVIALLFVTVASAGAGAAGQLWQARSHLLAAGALAGQLQQQLARGEVGPARQTLAVLQRHTRAARATTTGTGWRFGVRGSGLGGNLAAVAAVAVAVDDLAHTGLPPLVAAAGELDPARLAPRRGRIDLAAWQQADPLLGAAEDAVREARDRVAAIPTGGLIPPLAAAVEALGRDLEQAAAFIGQLSRVAAVAPGMLGAQQLRSYLVLFQNPAEVRATGGMPGAFAVIEADRGALRIVQQGSASEYLRTFDRPVLPLDPQLRALYTDRPGIYPANINLSPHFPTAAALARQMYRQRSGRAVDGVIATDPVALSYLLRATGPVALPGGGMLTAGNAVRVLLSEAYAGSRADPDAHHEYFAAAAAAVFEALVAGGADPRSAADSLIRAAGGRRLLLWSARPQEQALIEGTVLAGELPVEDGLRPVVGVFLNDGSGAKLGYYLTQAARLHGGGCRADGRRELRLAVTLGSTAPAHGLPEAVLGLGLAGDPYTIRTQVLIFSPAGGAVAGVRVDGAPAMVGAGTERNRAVAVAMVDIRPGTSRLIEATVLTGRLPADHASTASTAFPASTASTAFPAFTPELWVTPAVTPWRNNVSSVQACPVHG